MRSPEELTTLFRSTGRKVTPQRQRIFHALHGNERHPTAEGVYADIVDDMPTVSLMSIKRVLIAAAGRGARLDRPGMPKPLVFVAGLPMILRTLVQCEEAGIEEAVVVVGYEAPRRTRPTRARAAAGAGSRRRSSPARAGSDRRRTRCHRHRRRTPRRDSRRHPSCR